VRILSRVIIAIVALVVLLAIAAWSCPAAFVYPRFADSIAPVRLHELSGTALQGRAEGTQFLGVELGAVEWRIDPWPLLHRELVAQVDLRGAALTAAGVVHRNDDEVGVTNATLRLPARLAAPALAIPSLDLLGTIEIDIARAVARDLRLDTAAGTATWRDAAVAGAAQAQLGDLQATFAADGAGGIAGEVKDLGGPLVVAGTFTANLFRYHAQVRLAARGDNPQLVEALQYVGQPQGDGSRNLEIEGRQLALPVQ